MPDICGLSAQVAVRSPFLHYRLPEFAARLPHHFKIGDPADSARNKFLPRTYYQRDLGEDGAWSLKKGMGYNLKWHVNIVRAGRPRS